MSLTARYSKSPGDGTSKGSSSGFSCPHYVPAPGSKRCRHYVQGGACDRPDEFMCTEWLKANGPADAEPSAKEPASPEQTPTPEPARPTDLFGNPLPEPKPPVKGKAGPQAPPPAAHRAADDSQDHPPLRGLTTEDVESFKALDVEVCVSSEALGQVWLVPEYTSKDRKEITAEHAATICRVLEAFPGSTVVAFHKKPETNEEVDA